MPSPKMRRSRMLAHTSGGRTALVAVDGVPIRAFDPELYQAVRLYHADRDELTGPLSLGSVLNHLGGYLDDPTLSPTEEERAREGRRAHRVGGPSGLRRVRCGPPCGPPEHRDRPGEKGPVSRAFLEADARTRTADPFITSDGHRWHAVPASPSRLREQAKAADSEGLRGAGGRVAVFGWCSGGAERGTTSDCLPIRKHAHMNRVS